jgi:transposase
MPCLVDDQFWLLIEPLLPRPPRRYRHSGRKRLDEGAGVFERLHQLLLARLRQTERLDLSHAVCDSSSVRALLGARRAAPTRSIAPAPAANTT